MIKFWNILVIFSFLSSSGIGQDINQTDTKGRKQGKWIKYHEGTEKKRYVGHFKDDKPIGEFVYFYQSGKPSASSIFKDAGNIVYTEMYFENGNLMAKGKYADQQKDSTWWYFTEDKKMLSREFYQNGKLNGEVVVYFPTDPSSEPVKVSEVTTYKDGLKNGEWKQFYSNGKVKAEGIYIDGNYDGFVKWYYENGEVEMQGFYKHAVKHGFWKYFDTQGEVEKKVYYKYGEVLEGEKLEQYLEKLKEEKQ